MKRFIMILITSVVLLSVICFLSCNDSGSSDSGGLVKIYITGTPVGASVDDQLYMGLYESGSDPYTSSLLAKGDITLSAGTEYTFLYDSGSSVPKTISDGDYDLYLWVDTNDNMNLVQEPESTIDLSHISFPLDITVEGDTTFTLVAAAFQVHP